MADFCKGCTEELFGEDLTNDFHHFRSIQMALCEGCGVHWFNAGGERSHPVEGELEALPKQCPVCFPEEDDGKARWEADHPDGVITPEERASLDSYEGQGV